MPAADPGKGGSDWGYAAVPVLAPIIGAAFAGPFVNAFGMWRVRLSAPA